MKCPFIQRILNVNDKGLVKIVCSDMLPNTSYTYFILPDGLHPDKTYQFCKIVGIVENAELCFFQEDWCQCKGYLDQKKKIIKGVYSFTKTGRR